MPIQRQITSAGATYDDIVATIPCHYLKIWPDGDRNVAALQYKLPNDSFTAVYTSDVSIGDVIELVGPGRHGFLGVPAEFARSGQAATVMAKVRFADSASRVINILEDETQL